MLLEHSFKTSSIEKSVFIYKKNQTKYFLSFEKAIFKIVERIQREKNHRGSPDVCSLLEAGMVPSNWALADSIVSPVQMTNAWDFNEGSFPVL